MSFHHVQIYYGPCQSTLNNVIYRPRKLKGIRVALQKQGYRVDFVPVQWRDYCMLAMCGHEVFRCNVKHLKFNTSVERDPVAQRAVDAVIMATNRCLRARTRLWLREMLFEAVFRPSELTHKEYWDFDVDMYPFTFECKTCCGRLTTQNEFVIPKAPPTLYWNRRLTTDINEEEDIINNDRITKIRF